MMHSYGLILLAQIACLIHAGRTGRPYFWFMIILFVPGLGILAYLAVEVIPGLLRGRAAARLSQTVIGWPRSGTSIPRIRASGRNRAERSQFAGTGGRMRSSGSL